MEQEDFYRGLVTGPAAVALAALVLRRDAMLALQDLRVLGATPLPTAPTRVRLLARAVALLERLAGSEVGATSATPASRGGAQAVPQSAGLSVDSTR